MSKTIGNPYYQEGFRYKMKIFGGTNFETECDCNIDSAVFNLKNGSDINNPFSSSMFYTGNIVTDYIFFEGQEILVKMFTENDELVCNFGEFEIIDKSGEDFINYYLRALYNSDGMPAPQLNNQISMANQDFSNMYYLPYNTAIQIIYDKYDALRVETDLPMFNVNCYDTSDFNQYTIGRLNDLNKSIIGSHKFKKVDIQSTPPLLLPNGYEAGSDNGFNKNGISLIGLKVKISDGTTKNFESQGYLSFNTELLDVSDVDKTFYFGLDDNNNLIMYSDINTTDEKVDLYEYDNGSYTTKKVDKPTGNSYVIDFPFTIGNPMVDIQQNTSDFILGYLNANRTVKAKLISFFKLFKDIDLTYRKITMPFNPLFMSKPYLPALGRIYDVYGIDLSSEYSNNEETITLSDEKYNELLESKRYSIIANEIIVTYDGGAKIEINSGEQWSGGNSVSSTSTSTITNISSQSGGTDNISDLYLIVANLQKQLSATTINYLTKEDFAQRLSDIFENAKLDGAIIKDSTIKGSSIEESIFKDGKIQGSAIDGSTFTNGSIIGTAIDGSTFTDGSIIGTAIDGSTFTDGQISGSKIDSSTLTNIPYASMDEAFVNDLVSDSIFADELKAEVATFGYLDAQMANIDFANLNKANIGQLFANVGLLSSATITDGHVTGYLDSVEVNANKITAGTLAVDRLLIKDSSGNYKMATYDESGNVVTTTIDGSVITERTITADHLVAGTITANEINMTDLVGNSAFINALSSNVIEVTKQPYYTVSETPTLTNYPANTFYSHRLYKDGIKFGLPFAENMFSSHIGSKAYDNDGHSWVFDKDSEGNFYWADTSYSLETQLKNLTKTVEGVTYIDGGHIYTNSIKADSIDTKNLTVENLVTSHAEFRPNGNNFIYQNDDAFPFIICKSKKEKDIGLFFSSTGIILQGSISFDDYVTIQGQDGIYYFGSLNNKPKIYIGSSVTPIEEIHSSVIYEGGSELSEKYATKAELRSLGINI